MFIEPQREKKVGQKIGWVEVICGSMFSGKTEELIRRLNRADIARQKVQIFKPAVDTRYHEENIVSHSKRSIVSEPVATSSEILTRLTDCEVVGIDEAQFFDLGLVQVVATLANQGKRIIIAGLDMDSRGNPFGPMPALMATAEYVTKVHAICVVCGDVANYSYRKTANEAQVMLGEADTYEARCRRCFHNVDE
jgi:thymidine kinase